MRNHDDKKFEPEDRPFKQNKIYSIYRVTDENNYNFYAKFFLERKLIDLNIFQSTEYNQAVLSDLSDQMFPQHFVEIKYTYSIPEGFIFVTDPYEYTLETYLKTKVIEEKQAMEIFNEVVKASYSLYMAGFWHRNIRPEHIVKANGTWKMESLVYNENYKDANGLDCEFIWNPAYQPPEVYEREGFSEEQLDQMMVWNLGSLLLNVLLSTHRLKDKTVLDRYANNAFSLKAIGVKKEFSKELTDLLSKMLHYTPTQRMTLKQLFTNEFVCKDVAKIHNKGQVRKNKIYVAGRSTLSKSLATNRKQSNINSKNFKKDKEDMQASIHQISSKTTHKIQSKNQLYKKIHILTTNNAQQHHDAKDNLRNSRLENFMANPNLKIALEAYKCYYDKCELLLIASNKIQSLSTILSQEVLFLNKYAMIFVSLNTLYRLAESMNRNLNYLNLDAQVWSEFQESKQFKGFKEIMNYRRSERSHLLEPLRQAIVHLSEVDKALTRIKEIQQFVQMDYKITRFPIIKNPYRKIIKQAYDCVTKQYNLKKTDELARIGMYITYCMAVDKMYIPSEITDNFTYYFQWMNVAANSYVPVDSFQQYADNADKKILVSHSIYILKKYFNKSIK